MDTGRVPLGRLSARRRSALAGGVVVLLLLGVVSAHCGLPRLGLHAVATATSTHRLLTTPATGFVPAHAHALDHDNAKSPCPTKLLSASLPESADGWVLLAALIVPLGTVVAALAGVTAPTVRGPPARSVAPLAGQARLARFCVSRR